LCKKEKPKPRDPSSGAKLQGSFSLSVTDRIGRETKAKTVHPTARKRGKGSAPLKDQKESTTNDGHLLQSSQGGRTKINRRGDQTRDKKGEERGRRDLEKTH